MWTLAIAAVERMGPPEAPIYSSSILRDFEEREWTDIRDTFKPLIGTDCPINGPDELQLVRICWDTSSAGFAEVPGMNPSYACESFPGHYGFGTKNVDDPNLQPDIYHYWIILCPAALTYKTEFDSFDCSILEPSRAMHDSFLNGGQMILHELIQWPYISDKAVKGGSGVRDWNTDPETGQPIDPLETPLTGYGPFEAWAVNRFQGRGSENLDNYAWFAYESHLLQDKHGSCGGEAMDTPLWDFGDPLWALGWETPSVSELTMNSLPTLEMVII